MRTKKNVEIRFKGFGIIKVPKGIRLTNKTAQGISTEQHFVDEFEWIKTSYPDIQNTLTSDAIYYGIDIPKEFVEFDTEENE